MQRDLESILQTGCYCFHQVSGRQLEMRLRFQVPEQDNMRLPLASSPLVNKPMNDYIIWGKEDITDFEQRLALLDGKEDTKYRVESFIEWNKVFISCYVYTYF